MVYGKKGSDYYNLTYNKQEESVIDYGGNDKYNISQVFSSIYIYDTTGVETYNISNATSTIYITDGFEDSTKGGDDKLTITSANKKNFIFMADFKDTSKSDDFIVDSGALFIFDKTTAGCTKIDNFFETYTDNDKDYVDKNSTGTGKIETIMAGKKNVANDITVFLNDTNYAQLSGIAGAWLDANKASFTSVTTLFNIGSDNQIRDFVATLTTTNV